LASLFVSPFNCGRPARNNCPAFRIGRQPVFFTDIFSIGEQAACGRLPLARWVSWVDKMEKKAVFLHYALQFRSKRIKEMLQE
jgi:hypothetical protein